MSILDRLEALEKSIANVNAVLGIGRRHAKNKAASASPHTEFVSQVDMLEAVMQDGLPKDISKITSEATKLSGKKQKRASINAACSKLYRDGIFSRPDKGIYQKAA